MNKAKDQRRHSKIRPWSLSWWRYFPLVTKLSYLYSRLRESFWFIPGGMILAAVTLAFLMRVIDERYDETLIETLPWIEVTPSTAQAILSSLAGAMATIVGVVFSIAILTLSIASSQMGPRLLRTFLRQRFTHYTLGVFIGTTVYCLLVLVTIRDRENYHFAPYLGVLLGVVFGVASFLMLVYFIHRVAYMIQAPNVVHMVSIDLDHAIDRLFPDPLGDDPDMLWMQSEVDTFLKRLGESPTVVRAEVEGYVQAIDLNRVLHFAEEHDYVIRILYRPGHFLVRQAPFLHVWPQQDDPERIGHALRGAFLTGNRPTPLQDVEAGVNELVEVAVRALSPGINDPYTAMNCVDRLGAALSRLAQRRIPSPLRTDDAGTVRIIAQGPTFPGTLDTAFNQIRQYGSQSVAVILRMLEVLTLLGGYLRREEDRAALRRHALMLLELGEKTFKTESDLIDLRARYEQFMSAAHTGAGPHS